MKGFDDYLNHVSYSECSWVLVLVLLFIVPVLPGPGKPIERGWGSLQGPMTCKSKGPLPRIISCSVKNPGERELEEVFVSLPWPFHASLWWVIPCFWSSDGIVDSQAVAVGDGSFLMSCLCGQYKCNENRIYFWSFF